MTSIREPELLPVEHAVPTAGTRWLRKNGKHRDNEVEVVGSNGLSVQFKDLGGGAALGNQKIDPSRINTLPYESFMRQYVPGELASTNGGQRAFRAHNPPRRPAPEPQSPLALNGGALTGDTVTSSIEDITPSQAQAWVDRGGHNRATAKARVHRYARVMALGEWQLNGEAIKLDRDGRVIDGKHRLLACIESGATFRTFVIRGLPPEIFPVLDIGKNRTPGDIMGIAGYKDRVAMASAARGLVLIEASGRYDPATRREYEPLYSHAALLRYVEEHPDVEQGVRLANELKTGGLSGGSGLMGTLFTLLLRADEEKAFEFAEALKSGADLGPNSPILRYRNRLIGNKQQRLSSSNADREQLLALGIKAWNAWRRGETLGSLTFHPQRAPGTRAGEAFPVPV